jgi:hypothetical protein
MPAATTTSTIVRRPQLHVTGTLLVSLPKNVSLPENRRRTRRNPRPISIRLPQQSRQQEAAVKHRTSVIPPPCSTPMSAALLAETPKSQIFRDLAQLFLLLVDG